MTRQLAVKRPFLRHCSLLMVCASLAACAVTAPHAPSPQTPAVGIDAQAALRPDVWLLGEQHDVPAHQQAQRDTAERLRNQARWGALVIEMAERGANTLGLPTNATPEQVRTALHWERSEAAGWRWPVYGPLVMQAVAAGVPVWGGNLPRAELPSAMQDASLDASVPPAAWAELQNGIREGHCQLLPESQVVPMTRVQVARDRSLADTARLAIRPGATVLLVAGNQHVRRDTGAPLHLPPALRTQVTLMATGPETTPPSAASADQVWHTAPVPTPDHCAELKASWPVR